jgi:hypothetical protein
MLNRYPLPLPLRLGDETAEAVMHLFEAHLRHADTRLDVTADLRRERARHRLQKQKVSVRRSTGHVLIVPSKMVLARRFSFAWLLGLAAMISSARSCHDLKNSS